MHIGADVRQAKLMTKRIVNLRFLLPALFALASCGDNRDTRRLAYVQDICHDSTANIIQASLKENGQSMDDFCGCVAKRAVKEFKPEEYYAYAIAYHETNTILELSKGRQLSESEFARLLSIRSETYKDNPNISYERLAILSEPASGAIAHCLETVIAVSSPTLRKSSSDKAQ